MKEETYRPRHQASPSGEAGWEEQAPPAQNEETGVRRALLRFLLKLGVAAVFFWAVLSFLLGVFVVHDNNMYPAVRDGDLIITYRPAPAARNAVVAYTAGGERRFGRVVGMEGDVIDMDGEGHFSVNGTAPYETVYYETRSDPDSGPAYPYTVPEGTLFVLNDLRDNTNDSRRFGAVSIKETDGSAALMLRRRGW